MQRRFRNTRRLFAIAVLLFAAGRSDAQITWTLDYQGDPFYTAQRQTVLTNVTNYISQQVDGRGNVTIQFDSANQGSGPLAQGGASFVATNGFTNGLVYRQAITGTGPFSPPQGSVTSNTAVNWYNLSTGNPGGSQSDFHSVMLHELTHSLGFTSYMQSNGSGFNGNTASPDIFSRMESFFRLGSAVGSPSLTLANAQSNGAIDFSTALIGGNIYFHGEIATEANGGTPVKMYAPGSFNDSSLAHLDQTANSGAVMTPFLTVGTAGRTFKNYELAMLIDFGWNQFAWKNVTGNWADNVSSLTNSRWTDGNSELTNVLSPVGTITPNLVLTFNGSGSTAYTSTNNLNTSTNGNRFLLMRMILNSSSTGADTIASNGTNILQFGSNLSIVPNIPVVPMIRQDNTGAFVISHPMELLSPVGTSPSLKLAGAGTGLVTISAPISDAAGNVGSIRKEGTSNYILSGANTYTGTTTVTAGRLLVNGSIASTAAVAVTGGTLGGTGLVQGAVTVSTGGEVSPGGTVAAAAGILTFNNGVTFNAGSTFTFDASGATAGNGGANHDRLVVNGPVSINTAAILARTLNYAPNLATDKFFLIDNTSGSPTTGNFSGLPDGTQFTFGAFQAWIYYTGNTSTLSLTGGNDVVISFVPAVPEPTCLLGLAGGILLLRRRVRRAA